VIAYLSTTILSEQNNSAYFNNYALSHSHSNSDYDALQTKVSDLSGIIDIKDSTSWFSNQTISNIEGDVATWKANSPVPYAGYIEVQVSSLTGNNNTFVEMVFSSADFNYDTRQQVGVNGTAVFPILPTSNLEVKIGTLDNSTATETVSIVYFY
jgi:hypothetical protein